MRGRNQQRSIALATAASATIVSMLFTTNAMATKTWTGDTSATNLWLDGTNWAGGVAPTPGVDDLIFAGANNTSTSNNYAASSVFKGITFDRSAGPFTLAGTGLHLGVMSTGIGITGCSDIVNNSTVAQTINLPISLDDGKHLIATGSGALNLHAAVSPVFGATAAFSSTGGAINVTGSGLATTNGILGGWATLGGTWAALDGSNNVVGYSGFNDIAGNAALPNNAASNVRITTTAAQTTAALPAPITAINSLVLNPVSAGNSTIAIGTGNTLVLGQNGGFFNPTQSGGVSRNLVIGAAVATGGTITAGDGINPAQITFSESPYIGNVSGNVTINSAITDNGAGKVSVTYEGGYFTASGVNTYSGDTYVVSGRVSQPTGTTFGSGAVHIYPGAYINPGAGANVTLANNMFISGNGTSENNGLGAIRAFNSATASTLLTGTITLTDNASISSNGNTQALINGGRNVAFTGQITGPGGLGIGSPTTNSANGSGIVQIGSLDGTNLRINNYAGDTTINGATGGAAPAGLLIGNALDNNIMPHGSTGSFSNGPTGNVVLNANGTRQAFFDLNGSAQTINGLSSTAASAANNFVQSNSGAAVLTVGDNNATATFGGIIQNGGGSVALVKIGSGIQSLTGANTYTGNTTVQNGTLSVNNALASNVLLDTTSFIPTLSGAGGNLSGTVTMAANNGLNKATIAPGATAAAGSIGALTLSSLTVNGGNLAFDLATPATSDSITVSGAVAFNSASTVTVGPGSAGVFTLLTAGSITGTTPTLVAPVSRLTYAYDANSYGQSPGGNAIIVDVTGSVANLVWTPPSAGNGAWDVNNTANWTAGANHTFFNSDNVTFDDSGPPLTRAVTLNTTVAPGSVTVNSTGAYSISGSGSIGGTGGITKNNTGSLTLATANTYSGNTVLNLGTLNINNASAIGTGNLVISGGTIDNTSAAAVTLTTNNNQTWNTAAINYTGTRSLNLGTGVVTINVDPTITVTASTLAIGGINPGASGNNVSKAGNGTLAINGASNYTGTTTVNAGTVVMGNAAAFGPTGAANGAFTLASGATLDVSGITSTVAAPGFGPKVFNIAGNGSGSGAIVDNNPTGVSLLQQGFNNVTLTANASIGGTNPQFPAAPNLGIGRIDIGRSGPGVVDLQGNTLTKSGTNQLNFAPGTSIVSSTGLNPNIVVNGGVLSFESTAAASANDKVGNIIMNTGTILEFTLTTAGNITAPIVFNGSGIQMGQPVAGTSSIDSNMFLNGNVSISPQNSFYLATAILTLTGNISDVTAAESASLAGTAILPAGAGSLTKTGGSVLNLNGTNTYTGGTTVQGGILRLNSAGAFPSGTALSLGDTQGNSGTLDLNGNGITVSSLSSAAGANPSNAVISAPGTTLTYAGGVSSFGANIGGAAAASANVALTVTSGALTLTGSNGYSQDTNVNGGSLTIGATGSVVTPNLNANVGGTINIAGTVPLATNISANGGTVNFAGNTTAVPAPRAIGTLNIATNGLAKVQDSTFPFTPAVLTAATINFTDATSKLDLTRNELISPGTAATALGLITAGNVFSSSGTANLGYITLDASNFEIRWTLLGDTNLDGKVNVSDLGNLATNFGSTSATWIQGDFDRTGTVNVADLGDLATNFGQQLAAGSSLGGSALAASAASAAAVPEPTSLGLIGLGATALLARRRRNIQR